MFLYGAIAFMVGIPWLLTRSGPNSAQSSGSSEVKVPMRQAVSHVFRIRNVWLLGLMSLGQMGCAIGMRGYLPLYLRGIGWAPASADAALASYAMASMIGVIPITLLSNRLGSRKVILFFAMLITALGTGLLSVVGGTGVWICVIVAGMVWDGYMANLYSITMETEGIGAKYTGTAMGLIYTLARLGSITSPIIGNSLATISPTLAFIFWGGLGATCSSIVYFLREK
jgi:Na+/melibiose symporter-like transporter